MTLTATMLSPEEWPRLERVFKKLYPNVEVPTPDVASVAVVKDSDGAIRGFWFAKMVMHLEPAWIDPSLDGLTDYKDLLDCLHGALFMFPGLEYYLNSQDGGSDAKLQSLGFLPVGVAYIGRVPVKE